MTLNDVLRHALKDIKHERRAMEKTQPPDTPLVDRHAFIDAYLDALIAQIEAIIEDLDRFY